MSDYQRQRLSAAMKKTADRNRCPVCGRGAAMVERLIGERLRTCCRWIDLGKCERRYLVNDTRPDDAL